MKEPRRVVIRIVYYSMYLDDDSVDVGNNLHFGTNAIFAIPGIRNLGTTTCG